MRDDQSSLERYVVAISSWLNWTAGVALVVMVVVNVANILGRLIFNAPIKGTYEISEFLGAAIGAFAMSWTMVQRGHVSIDVLMSHVSGRAQTIVDAFTGLLSIGIFALLTWQSAVFATDLWESGQVSMGLRVPYYPVVYGVAFGCALLTLVLGVQLMQTLPRIKQQG